MADNNPHERMKEITDKLEQGIQDLFNSETYAAYLKTMSKFYNYSFNNTLLIYLQRPDASLIAGYGAWQKNFDRQVKRGEHGIKILAPSPYKAKMEMEKIDPATNRAMTDPDGKHVTAQVEITKAAFKPVTVFDVSQTDGRELPSLGVNELTGDVEGYNTFFEALEQVAPVPVAFEQVESGAKGYFHHEEQRIAINEGMSEIQNVKTAIHEITHAKLHNINEEKERDVAPEDRKDRHTKEVEAESVAYTVCQHYGIDTSDYSFAYVAGWSSGRDAKELKSSMELIRSTAAGLIYAIDAKVLEISKQQEATLPDSEVDRAGALAWDIDSFSKRADTNCYTDIVKGSAAYRSEITNMLKRGDISRLKIMFGVIGEEAPQYHDETAALAANETSENIYERFNLDLPDDYRGHSLSVSDIVVMHRNGTNSAHCCDSFGFKEVPDFIENTREKSNYLMAPEKSTEQNYNMIDGQINNEPPKTEPGAFDALEAKVAAGEPVSVLAIAEAAKAEKANREATRPRSTKTKTVERVRN